MKSVNLKNEKIKYVSIGDSISEGYNGRYNFGYAGCMDEQKNIYGTSWPSYLARFIQKIDKSLLYSYENFSMSGTRPEDWIYFLGLNNEKYNYENSIKKIKFSRSLNEIKTNPERNRIKRQFKKFGKTNQSDFDYLKEKLREANLITINIGANYIIPRMPFDEIAKLVVNEKIDATTSKSIDKKIDSIISEMEEQMNVLLPLIKKINNKASIYLVGYNKLSSPFWETINLFLFEMGLPKDYIGIFYNKINASLRRSAKKNKIYFISTNNQKFWAEHNYQMSNVFYEVHPTILGYKKMAQDIFAKISLSNSFFEDKNKIIKSIKSFNKEYINDDFGSFKNGLDFSKLKISNSELIEKIYGKKDEILFKITNVEKESKFLETDLFIEQSLDENNDPDQSLKFSLKQSISIILSSLNINFESLNKNLNKIFENKTLNSFVNNSKLVSIISNKIQKNIDDYFVKKHENVSIKLFSEFLFKNALDLNLISSELKKFSLLIDSSKIKKDILVHKNEIVEIIEKIFKIKNVNLFFNDVNKSLIEFLFTNWIGIDDKDIINFVIKNLDSKINVSKFISVLVDVYFSSISLIKKSKDTKQMISIFLNSDKLKSFILSEFERIANEIEIGDDLCILFMNKANIPVILNNKKIIKNFLNEIISILKENKNSFKIILEIIFSLVNFKKEKITLQSSIDFILNLDKKNFWVQLSKLSFDKISNQKFENIVKGFELFFNNLSIESGFFQAIINLQNPSDLFNKKTFKVQAVNLLKYFDKLNQIKKPLNSFFKCLMSNFYTSKIKTKNNIYYKCFFRFLLIMILTLRQLFQQNVDKNIFMNGTKISIVEVCFKIAGFQNGKNKGIDSLILRMFNEENNFNLKLHKNGDIDNILYLIFSLDKNEKNMYTNIDKIKRIFNSLRDGFIK